MATQISPAPYAGAGEYSAEHRKPWGFVCSYASQCSFFQECNPLAALGHLPLKVMLGFTSELAVRPHFEHLQKCEMWELVGVAMVIVLLVKKY